MFNEEKIGENSLDRIGNSQCILRKDFLGTKALHIYLVKCSSYMTLHPVPAEFILIFLTVCINRLSSVINPPFKFPEGKHEKQLLLHATYSFIIQGLRYNH